VLRLHNIPLDRSKRAQLVNAEDLRQAQYLVAMDTENIEDLRRMTSRRVPKLLEFAPHLGVPDVPDPYYHNNFDFVFQLVTAGCRGLLQHIRQKEGF
jgi:protein-tyrosine phosphatase